MIISASYKTDIPTFYGEWMINRLRAGYCMVVNPYNRQPFRVDLRRSAVDGIVFWTKNVAPFLRRLPEVKDRGYPFVVQHTINGYPRALETSVVDRVRSIESAWKIRESYGPHALVWRYDTILSTDLTPATFHVENFGRLAERLAGATNECVISFAHVYKKTKTNVDQAAEQHGFRWWDPTDDDKRALTRQLLRVARAHGIGLTICSQPAYLVEGAPEARCVDAQRLTQLAGHTLQARLKGNRKECGCFESRDIGDYDTCPHGCVYCYAVQNRDLAQTRFREHDPTSEFLITPTRPPSPPSSDGHAPRTLSLFGDD